MSLLEELKSLGADVEEGLDRVMGDNALYEAMMGMFIDSVNNNPVSTEDFSRTDLSILIERTHMLKDVTGNLSITPLFKRYTRVEGFLRADQAAEARQEFEQLLPVQAEIIGCIKRHIGC